MESRWIWPFELLNKVGEGGMGVVYRARYVRNDRMVAVKLLPAEAAENQTLLARFEREMEVLKSLDHPNIVHCFGGTCEGEQRFYAMELVEGGTLAQLIRKRGRLTWDIAIDYAIQMAEALDYAHERGVIHRDVKPSNFLLTKQGQIKLSDFGLVTVVAGRKLTASGRTLGTVDYMSPEQIRGNPLTNRSDLYALGCVIYEMVVGQAPYTGETTVEMMHKHLKAPIPRLADNQYDGPQELDDLLADLLAKSAEQRPESASTVALRLKDILQPGRNFSPVEPTAFPAKLKTQKVATKVNVTPAPDSEDLLPVVAPPSLSRGHWIWTGCLMILTVIGLMGWYQSSKELRRIEQRFAEELTTTDVATQIQASRQLAQLGRLHAGTVDKLKAAIHSGPEAVALAALDALARHPRESSGLQWEIYKLQQNSEVSSGVRSQAAKTVEAIQRSRTGSLIGTVSFWSMVLMMFVALGFVIAYAGMRLRPKLSALKTATVAN